MGASLLALNLYYNIIKKHFTKSAASASEWFLSTINFLLVSLFPTVERTKKAATPTLGLFIEHKLNMRFRLIIYEENMKNLHCINK